MSKTALPPGLPLPIAAARLANRSPLPSLATSGVVAASSTRATVTATASGSTHTKGSWQEVVAATATETTCLWIVQTNSTGVNGQNSSTLLDIGVGGAGSESVIVPNLGVGYRRITTGTFQAPAPIMVPVTIPAGSRVAVRCQSATASKQYTATYIFGTLPDGRRPPTQLINIGADTATSKGVDLATPGSTHTKTSYTQVTAATTMPLRGLIVCPQGAAGTVIAATLGLLDIAVGAAAAEVVVIPDIVIEFDNSEAVQPAAIAATYAVDIPAGSRIAARHQAANTATPMDLTLIGIPK